MFSDFMLLPLFSCLNVLAIIANTILKIRIICHTKAFLKELKFKIIPFDNKPKP